MGIAAQLQPGSEQVLNTGKLLSIQERSICEQLARGTDQPSQLAKALLAIDEGASRSEAAKLSGLTSRQVRYWLAKFRRMGLGIFPQQALEFAAEELIVTRPAGADEPQVEVQIQENREAQADVLPVAEEVPKKKKAKKDADKKKKKKDKKDKDKKKEGKKGKSKDDKPPKKSKKDGKKKSKKKSR